LRFTCRLVDGALALDVVQHTGIKLTINSLAHSHCESLGWLPLGRCSWCSLFHHLINLLKRQALGFGNQEIRVDEGGGAEATPNEENRRSEVALVGTNHVGCDDGDDSVPQPVGGSGETDTTSSDREREDLADDNPSSRTPGRGKEEDEDSDEGNLRVDCGNVVGNGSTRSVKMSFVEADGDTNDSNKELTNQHAESTIEKDGSSTEFFDSIEGDGSGADVHQGEDQGDQKGVADGTSRLQEWG